MTVSQEDRLPEAILHAAICNAVQIIDTEPWRASAILRTALINFADAARATQSADETGASTAHKLTELTDEQEAMVQKLRSFGDAYPEDVFGPVTEDERTTHGGLITRTSAAMGRHCAKFMVQAANEIERLAGSSPARQHF